ncbi:hypothetical protein F2Q69_00008898 [Brassica cretica]|uniref:Uncharacterized protein n=1 Tax=Brassica cretica TaxID=69181 RepID=A0A8S9PNZ7_BRACR|nr:hypothetical protein F2Q69_00008898 [Brassica cretica]
MIICIQRFLWSLPTGFFPRPCRRDRRSRPTSPLKCSDDEYRSYGGCLWEGMDVSHLIGLSPVSELPLFKYYNRNSS